MAKFRNSRETGAILPFMVFVIGALSFMLILSVDMIRLRLAAKSVESISEAMAHIGANRLNYRLAGWRRAKREVLAALEYNKLYSTSGNFRYTVANKAGLVDPYESRPTFQWTDYTWPQGVTAVVERGLYEQDPATLAWAFRSVEGNLNEPLDTTDPNSGPVYTKANAVRVRLKLQRLDLFFTKLLPSGFDHITDIEFESIAAMEDFRG